MNMPLRLLMLCLTWRRRPRHGLLDASRLRFRVRLGDLDIFLHMNNARYLALMDIGRVDHSLRCGFWQQIRSKGWHPVVAAERIRFFRSLKLFQTFWLETEIDSWDETRVYMEQRFLAPDGKIIAIGQIAARFLASDGRRLATEELLDLVALPQALRSRPPSDEVVTAIGRDSLAASLKPEY